MPFMTEMAEKLAEGLGFTSAIIIRDYIARLSEQIEKAPDEESKERLEEYRRDLREIGVKIYQLLGKLTMDENVDPPVSEGITKFLSTRGQK